MIARKSALIVATQIINGLLGYIGLKFIAKYMQPWQYGIVGFAYGFVALFSIFGNLGFNAAHIKRVSEGKDLEECIATFATVKIILAGLMTGIVILSILIWKYVFGRGFETPLHEKAIYLMLSYFVLSILASIMTSTFTARKEIAKTRLPLFFYNLTRIAATIFVAFYNLGVLALAYTYIFGEIFHFAFALFLFKGYPIGKPSLEYFKNYFSFAKPMAIATASSIIMTNIDKVFIQLFWSATQVGEYFAIFNLSRFIILFSGAIGTLLLPTVSEHHAKNNTEEIKRITTLSERYLSMIVFPIIAIMVVLAKPIIHMLLSDKYMPALHVLYILPLFVLLEALSRPYQSQLQGMNMPEYTRNRVFIMMLINVFLNLILIPRDIRSLGIKLAGLGAEGAAIATVISYFAGLVYIRFVSWRFTGIKGNKRVLLHVIAAIPSGLVLYYISKYVSISRWYHLIAAGMFGIAIYFGILFLMREFKREEINFFMDTLNIRKMVKYIKEELHGKRP